MTSILDEETGGLVASDAETLKTSTHPTESSSRSSSSNDRSESSSSSSSSGRYDEKKDGEDNAATTSTAGMDELKKKADTQAATAAVVRPGAYRASGGPKPAYLEKEKRSSSATAGNGVPSSPNTTPRTTERPKLAPVVRSDSVKSLVEERPEQAQVTSPSAAAGLLTAEVTTTTTPPTTKAQITAYGSKERLRALRAARTNNTGGSNTKWTSPSNKQRPSLGLKSFSFKDKRSKSPTPPPSSTGASGQGAAEGKPRRSTMSMVSAAADEVKPGAVSVSDGGTTPQYGKRGSSRAAAAAATPVGAVRSKSPAPTRGKSNDHRRRSSSTTRVAAAVKDWEEQAKVTTPTTTPTKTSGGRDVVELKPGAAKEEMQIGAVRATGGTKEGLKSSRSSAPSAATSAAAAAAAVNNLDVKIGAIRATGGIREGKASRASAPASANSAAAAAAVNNLDMKIGAVRATGGTREGKPSRASAAAAPTTTTTLVAAAAAINNLDMKIGAVRATGGAREGKASRSSAVGPPAAPSAATATAKAVKDDDDDDMKVGAVRATGGAREGKTSRVSQAAAGMAPSSNHGGASAANATVAAADDVKPGAVSASGGPRIAKRSRPVRASAPAAEVLPGAARSLSPAPQGKPSRSLREGPAQVAESRRVSTDIEEGAVVVTAAGTKAQNTISLEEQEEEENQQPTRSLLQPKAEEVEEEEEDAVVVTTVPNPPETVHVDSPVADDDEPAFIRRTFSVDSTMSQSKQDLMNNSSRKVGGAHAATIGDVSMKDQSKAMSCGTHAQIPEEDSPNLIEARLVDESARVSIYLAEEHDPNEDLNPKRTRRIAAGVLCCVAVAVAVVLSVVLTYDFGSEVTVTYPWEDDDTDYEKLKEECLAENADNCATHCAGIHGIDMHLADKCCAYAGRSASILAFEEDAQWVPRLEEFYKCTGAEIRLEYLPEGEDGMANALRNDLGDDVDHDQGNAAGQGLFDAYIVQAPWLWPVVNGLENLTPRIRENADTVNFLDINPASRSAVSYNGTVRALPLDSDYIALGWRQDVFHRYNVSKELSPPRTIEDLASLAEELNGLDFNEDGEPDWGICLTPQVNYFYAFVAPLMQSSLRDPFDGTPTGQNMFFSADTFEPLIRQPAFKTALEVYYKIIRNSNCGEQLANGEKCDRKTAFPTGRCAMVISMPGTLTKMLLDGAKYAPAPRTNDTTGEVLWDVNDMPLGSDGGSYWGRRAPFPGSRVVQQWDTEAGYPLVECADNDGEYCPVADDGINFAPFFAEGGEAYAINGRQSSPATKTVMWDFFTWLSELPEAELPLSGQYRLSHLNEEHREELTEHAGWPNQMVDDIFDVLGEYFKSEENGGNPVQDLLMLGFPEYMGALDEELHDAFLGVKKDSSGGVFNPEDPKQSMSPSHNVIEFNQAFDTFVDSLEARYSAISASISGGRMGQLQRWRSSLNLPWRTEEELCVSALSSNEVDAFNGLQCSFFVSFEKLCQTEPDAVANLDETLCESFQSGPNLGVIIPSIIIPLIVLAVIGGYCYGKMKKREAEYRWQIQLKDLDFDEPPEVIGHGRFGEVVLATYRGSRVAVKTMKVIPKNKEKSAAKEAPKNKPELSAIFEEDDVSELSQEPTPEVSSSSVAGNKSAGKSSWGLSSTGSFGLLDITKSVINSKSKGGSARDKFIKEIRLLTNLQEHRNIVCVMGAVVRGTKEPKLVLEYMERGSLCDFLRSDEQLGGKLILNILSDVAQGLLFLHTADPKVVHSDLKSSNILIDDRYRAKVSDFGWGNTGTPYWTAPEVLRGETPYTTESDVYAFGITLYEIYSRCHPYDNEDTATVLDQLKDPEVEKAPPCPASMSLVMQNMMKDCIAPQAHHRPTLQELVGRIGRLTIQDVEYQTGKNNDEQTLFPPNVATELAQGRKVETQTHNNVSVVYCEIADFGNLFGDLPPVKFADLIQRLNDCFDEIADDHVVFKVEMMGGAAWLGATNCVQHQPSDHVTRVARFALKAVEAAGSILIDEEDPERGTVQLQMAFTSGQVKGKVVGFKRQRYSLSGQAVNAVQILARDMCTPGRIVCGDLEQIILAQEAPDILTERNSSISVAGKHSQLTYWVNPPTAAATNKKDSMESE